MSSRIIIIIIIVIIIIVVAVVVISGSAAQRGLWAPLSRGFLITHNDDPQSLGLLWTSDQLVAETST
jgi:flagellar basal body-associated protein FliL